jgi:hypothetical protein
VPGALSGIQRRPKAAGAARSEGMRVWGNSLRGGGPSARLSRTVLLVAHSTHLAFSSKTTYITERHRKSRKAEIESLPRLF